MSYLRRVDLGLLVVVMVCVIAIWPFVSRPGLPRETDAELHVFRTVELHHLVQGGAVYPRWAPDFYFGHGYPLYQYYPPLVYYLATGLMLLTGTGAVSAVKTLFVLALLCAGLGMYLFVRRKWGLHPALVAAAVYVYAPYVQYIDPYARGVLAESTSFALFPWVLWAFARLDGRKPAGWRRMPLAAVLFAALIYTHVLMALVLGSLLAAWVAWQLVTHLHARTGESGDSPKGRAPWILLAALTAGAALSAFFWMPVWLEKGAVQLGNVVSLGGHFDFRNHFLSLAELLGPTKWIDMGATDPGFRFNVGIAQWLLALGGCGVLLWRRGRQRVGPDVAFWGAVAIALTLLTLPLSAPVWERVPLMAFLQFPWRLLGPLAACLSILSAALVTAAGEHALLQRIGTADALTGVVVGLVLFLGLPLTYPPEWEQDFGPADLRAIHERERNGWWLGTTSTGDYLPISVLTVPPPNDQVTDAYRSGRQVDRVNRVTLPAGTTVDLVDERPLAWQYLITGEKSFVFRLFHFSFPGWTATLDGERVAIETAAPEGFITVRVPAGRHELQIAFRDTLPRSLSWAVSGAALILCLLPFVLKRGTLNPTARPTQPFQRDVGAHGGPTIGWRRALLLALGPLLVLVFKLALADPQGWFHYRSVGWQPEPAQHTVFYEWSDIIALIGFDWEQGRAGGNAELALYWKAVQRVPERYQVFVHLRNEAGEVVAQSDKLNPGEYPTTRWPLDRYVLDVHRFSIPAGLAPGRYRLAVGLWEMDGGERLPAYDASGAAVGDSVFLAVEEY